MSNLAEKFEEDMAWIREEISSVSEELQEAFAERVAFMTGNGIDERRARFLAKRDVEKKLYG